MRVRFMLTSSRGPGKLTTALKRRRAAGTRNHSRSVRGVGSLQTGVKTVAPEQATLRDGVHYFREVQCLATSSDPQLLTWTRWNQPVLQPPRDPRLAGFRDPV